MGGTSDPKSRKPEKVEPASDPALGSDPTQDRGTGRITPRRHQANPDSGEHAPSASFHPDQREAGKLEARRRNTAVWGWGGGGELQARGFGGPKCPDTAGVAGKSVNRHHILHFKKQTARHTSYTPIKLLFLKDLEKTR